MSVSSAHSCSHCQKLVLDLIDGPTDYLERSGIPQNGLVFSDFTLSDIQQAYAESCALIEPIVSNWLWWDEAALSKWEDRADQIVLFALIANSVIDLENNARDLTEIDGFCLWDKVASERVDKILAGDFHVFTTTDDPAAECINTRPIAIRPDAENNFERIRQYLDDCFDKVGIHAECEAASTGKAPTRLLKIQTISEDIYDLKIDYPVGPVKYVALSYCWGGEQVHKTTLEKLPTYKLNIAWENLPKTIQDAVKVTAALNIEYIWVDSLCIVQDDEDDKAREIANMPNIYYEATVTIVAATAKTAGHGFLHERDPQALTENTFKLPFRCPDGRMGSAYLTKIGELQSGEHIDTRAWTLQESYLSKRLLRFGHKQCSLVCQCSPSKPRIVDGWKLDQDYEVPHLANILFLTKRNLDIEENMIVLRSSYKSTYGTELMYDHNPEETWEGNFIDLWMFLVEAYTLRSLSVPEDRCLAISGVADRIAPVLGSSYVAGHWEKFMPAELLWRVTTAPQPKPRTYQGPSWSWTSVNGPIQFKRNYDDASLEVQGVDIQLRSSIAPFGAVKHGIIRVCGKLLKTEWNGREVRGEDNEALFSKAILLSDMYWPDTEEMNFLENSAVDSAPEAPHRMALYFLEVCPPGSRDESGSIGLVLLEKTSSGPRSKFERIGMFDLAVYPEVGKPEGVSSVEWQQFLERRNSFFSTLECAEIEIE